MLRLIKLSLFGLLAGCLVATTAQAGCGYGNSYGGSSYNYGSGYGSTYGNYGSNYGSNFNRSYNNYGSNYGHFNRSNNQSVYHDTTHFDYHAPSFQRHGNHIDFVPGHYDLHRTGHFHH